MGSTAVELFGLLLDLHELGSEDLLVHDGRPVRLRVEHPNQEQELECVEGRQEEQQETEQPVEGGHETEHDPVRQPLPLQVVFASVDGLS